MSSAICSCGSCNKCARRALFARLGGLSLIDFNRVLANQLDFLNTLEQGQRHCRDFCEDLMSYFMSTGQYKLVQVVTREFLLPRAIMNSSIVWMVYEAFRTASVWPHVRKVLPLSIARGLSALSDRGVSFGDIIELYELPGWTSRFDWVILARNNRGELTRMLEHAPHRLPEHLWTVIKTTWFLLDNNVEYAVQNLRKQDGYGYAKNVDFLTLSVRAVYDFGPTGEVACAGGV